MTAKRVDIRNRRVYFEMRTRIKPSLEDVARAQENAGYHPAGYGGPYDVDSKQVGEEFVTTWHCTDSCD